jgi:hypothetical protein
MRVVAPPDHLHGDRRGVKQRPEDHAVAPVLDRGAGLPCSAVPMVADLLALRRVPARFFGVFMTDVALRWWPGRPGVPG